MNVSVGLHVFNLVPDYIFSKESVAIYVSCKLKPSYLVPDSKCSQYLCANEKKKSFWINVSDINDSFYSIVLSFMLSTNAEANKIVNSTLKLGSFNAMAIQFELKHSIKINFNDNQTLVRDRKSFMHLMLSLSFSCLAFIFRKN